MLIFGDKKNLAKIAFYICQYCIFLATLKKKNIFHSKKSQKKFVKNLRVPTFFQKKISLKIIYFNYFNDNNINKTAKNYINYFVFF
jgi:hypothetical protein